MKNKKAQVELQHDGQGLPAQSFNVPSLSRGAGGLRGTLTGKLTENKTRGGGGQFCLLTYS